MSRRIYIDMDGTLVDIVTPLMKKLGIQHSYTLDNYSFPLGLYNVFEEIGFPIITLRSACDFSFWENAPWMWDGIALFSLACGLYGPNNVFLVTDPSWSIPSCMGKRAWAKKNMPRWYPEKKRMIFLEDKSLLAGTGVLIDDKDEQVDAFNNAGGLAIQIPRLWNRLYAREMEFLSGYEAKHSYMYNLLEASLV